MPELTADQLEELLAKVAKRAAKEALEEMGLSHETAADDMREMRGLLDAWRDTKRTIRQSVVSMFTRTVVLLIVAGLVATYGKEWLTK